MDAVLVLRSVFLLMASIIATANAVPGFQDRFIVYGPRTSTAAQTADTEPTKGKQRLSLKPVDSSLDRILSLASNLRVPHAWFLHFYVLSVGLSMFWAVQVSTNGSAFAFIAANSHSTPAASMTARQILLVWTMMTAQGVRRLYESLVFSSPSSSKMWIAHWAAGLVFYACMSVAVWAEGIPTILSNQLSVRQLVILAPSLKSFIAIPIFLSASGIQYDCHSYLASLQKYSLPTHPIFQLLICPHYFAECLIYLALAVAAAPSGRLLNGTIACAAVFVSVNLGVTAKNSRQWYADKFGEDNIRGRWTMIPYVW